MFPAMRAGNTSPNEGCVFAPALDPPLAKGVRDCVYVVCGLNAGDDQPFYGGDSGVGPRDDCPLLGKE